jgi:uncharacterized protein with von Willebrand factor type A (vWA) domain
VSTGTATAAGHGVDPTAERLAVGFARVLRALEVAVPLDSVVTFMSALGHTGLADRDGVYWAGRATLVRRPEDIDVYDRAFAVFWDRRESSVRDEPALVATVLADIDEGSTADSVADEHGEQVLRFSAVERLRDKDFSAYTEDEMLLARRWMESLRLAGGRRPALRLVSAPRRGARPDVRATVRESLRLGGETPRRRWRRRGDKPRRIVFLLDVSGSMEPYARALVRFVHAGVAGGRRIEAFTLGTRLTRVTRELSARDPDRALARAGESVRDWSGGTRLGATLREFNDAWGVRGLARGAVVVVLSDGWDRGDPALLADEMQRLGRVAHRTVWVNPLKVTPGYAPLARGMAAALPHIDDFVEGHSLDALERLVEVLDRA